MNRLFFLGLPLFFIVLAFAFGTLWIAALMRGAPAQASIIEGHEISRPVSLSAMPEATESLDAQASGVSTSSLTAVRGAFRPPVTASHLPHIAIIIDDMGLNVRNSRRAVDFQVPITLSYLPYARDVQAQVDTARSRGHEIMLHLPMEPFDRHLSAGPRAMTVGMTDQAFETGLKENLNAFSGYVGINNHMGSRLTSTPEAMARVMQAVAERGVFFVDSWTSPRSVAYRVAADFGIPRGRRDVFLDHDEGTGPVWAALHQAERLARLHGTAVAIGHPKEDTLDVLSVWIPQAIARGVKIVPMGTLVYDGVLAGDPVLQADHRRQARAE